MPKNISEIIEQFNKEFYELEMAYHGLDLNKIKDFIRTSCEQLIDIFGDLIVKFIEDSIKNLEKLVDGEKNEYALYMRLQEIEDLKRFLNLLTIGGRLENIKKEIKK